MACHASGRLRLPHDAPWALSGPKVCHSEPERHLNRTQTHISIRFWLLLQDFEESDFGVRTVLLLAPSSRRGGG